MDWYSSIDSSIRELVRLLRDNGWNTTASCGHEYEGVIIIACYAEQIGGVKDIVYHLRNFLKANGYEYFEITRKLYQWWGQIVEDTIILKLLSPDWDARWK